MTTRQVRRPADRYGDRQVRRIWLVLASVLAVMAIAATVWWLARVSDAPVRAALLAWENPRNGSMHATLEIVRQPGTAITCDVVAVDLRRIIVGQTTVEVPAGPEQRLEVVATIPLQGDAVAPEIRSCTPDG